MLCVFFQLPFLDVLVEELRFVFKCKGSVKPVKKKASQAEAVNDIYGSTDYNYSLKDHPTWFPDVAAPCDATMNWSVPSYIPSSEPVDTCCNTDQTPTHNLIGATALVKGHRPCSVCCSSREGLPQVFPQGVKEPSFGRKVTVQIHWNLVVFSKFIITYDEWDIFFYLYFQTRHLQKKKEIFLDLFLNCCFLKKNFLVLFLEAEKKIKKKTFCDFLYTKGMSRNNLLLYLFRLFLLANIGEEERIPSPPPPIQNFHISVTFTQMHVEFVREKMLYVFM